MREIQKQKGCYEEAGFRNEYPARGEMFKINQWVLRGKKISELLPFSWSGAQPLGDTEPMWGRTGGEKLEGRERISNANKIQKAVLEIM